MLAAMSTARKDGRSANQLRPVTIETDFQPHPEGSALIKCGNTWVLCAASVEDGVPSFRASSGGGWVTAEYAMLPRSTHTRSGRNPGGRGKEIQRLIGRSLRAAVNLENLGERTITVDCDVLCADGGTRTASITGAWVAIAIAVKRLVAEGKVADFESILPQPIAAISVGIVDGEPRLDLPYEEDVRADTDMNLVMTENGHLIEIQGTAEGNTFSRAELNQLIDLAERGVNELSVIQREALEQA